MTEKGASHKERNDFFYVAKLILRSIWWFWTILSCGVIFIILFGEPAVAIRSTLILVGLYFFCLWVIRRERRKKLGLD